MSVLTLAIGAISQPPNTMIPCAWVKSVDVPLQPDLYVGTWYTIGVATKAWQRNNECTQVVINEKAGSTDRSYTGAFSKTTTNQATPNVNWTQANAELLAADLDTFNPPYKLQFPYPGVPANDFYIAATDGDGTPSGISAIVTYVCPPGVNNSQMFYLSRMPYFVPPVTADRLAAKAAQAISNAPDIQMDLVAQGQGWCNYPYTTTFAAVTQGSGRGDAGIQSRGRSSDLAVGLGVGLGLGVPLLLALAHFVSRSGQFSYGRTRSMLSGPATSHNLQRDTGSPGNAL